MPIIKSTTIKNASKAQRNVLEYILRPEAQYIDKNGKSLYLKHNILGKKDDLDFLTQQFLENLEYRKHKRSNNISILHDIISFHPKNREDISLEILKVVAKKYIQERNPLGMYVAVSHKDAEHIHLHVVGSALEFKSGNTMRLSKQEYSELQQRMNEFQQQHFPQLSHSVVAYGKENIKKKDSCRLQQIKNSRLRSEKDER